MFAARRLRSEKYSQCGWGTCTEDSETEFFHSDSEESELDFTDTDVPGKLHLKIFVLEGAVEYFLLLEPLYEKSWYNLR